MNWILSSTLSGILAATCSLLFKLQLGKFETNSLVILPLLAAANLLQWIFNTLAQKHCTSAVQVTLLVSAVNLVFTGVYGLFLGEAVSLKWFIGVVFIVAGSYYQTR